MSRVQTNFTCHYSITGKRRYANEAIAALWKSKRNVTSLNVIPELFQCAYPINSKKEDCRFFWVKSTKAETVVYRLVCLPVCNFTGGLFPAFGCQAIPPHPQGTQHAPTQTPWDFRPWTHFGDSHPFLFWQHFSPFCFRSKIPISEAQSASHKRGGGKRSIHAFFGHTRYTSIQKNTIN